jgi:hypothetical protein
MSSDAITPEPLPEPTPAAITPEPAPEAAPAPPPRFETQPYRPDGSAPPAALAMTLAGVLVAAVVIGFVASFLGQWFYLVLLFPLFMGFALGGAGMGLIRVGKLRNPSLAGVAAGLGGIMLMGSMHYFDYQRALSEAAEKFHVPRAMLEANTSFFTFIDGRAEDGVRIGRVAHGGDGMNLGHVGSYIYWLVEMIIVAVIAWVMMQTAAAAPFCIGCNLWKTKRPIAMIDVPEERLAVQAIQDGDVVRLLECASPVREVGLLLETAACPACSDSGEVDVSLERLTKNDKGQKQTATVVRVTYPGEVLPFLDGSATAS